jgi:hypothetical protein
LPLTAVPEMHLGSSPAGQSILAGEP